MAENSEKREGYPDRKTAEAMLAEAEKIDPGPWGNHCRVAAYAAEKIALSCGMNGEKAYVLGLLHDIGRKFFVRDLGHIYNGYRYMQSLGYFAVAKICLTHSFPNRDLDIYIGRIDIPESEALEVRRLPEEAEYDDYDRLIQLCDALAGSEGILDVEERMADVKRRYGNYPQAQWDKNLELLGYFTEKAGKNVYALLRRRDR